MKKMIDVYGSLQNIEILPKIKLRINDVEYVCSDDYYDVDVYENKNGELIGYTNNKKLLQ